MTEHKLTIAYLGPAGTYSEEAARQQCGDKASYKPEASIDEAIQAAESGQADMAVVPIENSSEGAVNTTYTHLLHTTLQMCGELSLPIHHQLLTNATSYDDIHDVVAHPQTLSQCRAWLHKHLRHAKQIPASSNSEAAKQAAEKADMAAIASTRAGTLYKLPILAADIEDDPSNTTRFIMLGSSKTQPTGSDKTSFVCSTADKPGALYKVLGVLADQGINMVKLESRPVRGSLHDYIFYIDVEGHQQDPPIAKTLKLLKDKTKFIKVLGSYPKEV